METGSLTLGEPRSNKQLPTVQVFMKRTETGFDSDLEPINASSVLIRGKFDWTNTTAANKWSTPRQAYRYNKLYIPQDSSDTYDTGDKIIHTRNRIRGFGNSVAIRFEGEAGKNMSVYGWASDMFASDEE